MCIRDRYNAIVVRPLRSLSGVFYSWMDVRLIDGAVNSTGRMTQGAGNLLRRLQTGSIGFYIFAMVLSIAAILILNLFIL